jgi:hypothetical protein
VEDEQAADRAVAAVALGLVGKVTGEGMLRWMHSQLVVYGAGGAGKSSCVAALAGKKFDPYCESTVSGDSGRWQYSESEVRPAGPSTNTVGESACAGVLCEVYETTDP